MKGFEGEVYAHLFAFKGLTLFEIGGAKFIVLVRARTRWVCGCIRNKPTNFDNLERR